MTSRLKQLQLQFDLKIAAFVLMDNHFHLLLLTPNEPINRVMYFFMKNVTMDIQKYSGRINKIFGGKYKGCLITEESYLFNVYKYIYRNPVRAGLSKRIEDYRYSTWKNSELNVETLFFNSKSSIGELNWLNEEFRNNQSDGIKRSLKRTLFTQPDRQFKNPVSRRF